MASWLPRRLLGALLLTMLVGPASAAWAQMGSTIIGTIRDGSAAALPGANVTLASPNLPEAARTTVTNDRGVYRFSELPPGLYELTATRPGLQTVTRQNLRVPVGTTLTMDFALGEAGGPDTATLSGPGPVVDVTSPAFTTQFPREELENLPFAALNQLPPFSPGVTGRSALGSAPDTNQFMIDGSASVLTYRGGTAGAVVHPYWIDEVQIVGAGANANFGEFSGVVTNVAIRSGSNRVSGQLEYRTTPSRWVSDNTGSLPDALREQFRPQEIVSRWTSLQQVGGPIIGNRVFFFTGFNYSRDKFFQAGTLGNVPQESRWPVLLARLTAVASRNVKVEGFVLRDEYHAKGVLGRNQLPETAGGTDGLVHSWNERLTWTPNSRTLVEVRNNGVDFQIAFPPGERRAGPAPRRDRITQILSGNTATFGDELARRILTGAEITRFADAFLGGSHEFQAGVEHDRMEFRSVSGFPGGRSFTDASGVPEQVVLWDGNTIESSGARTTLYVQDAWKTNRLSIHAGVRLASNRGSVPDQGTVFRTNPVSPRLGLAWDVGRDHKTVVRAGYGRLHEGLYPSVYDFLHTSQLTPQITARVLGPETFQELNRSATTTVALDDDVAHAYVDQYLAGVEREVLPSVSLKAQYIRRNVKDIWAFIDAGSQYAPVQRQDPGPDGRLGTPDDGSFLTVFNLLNLGQSFPVLTNPDAAFRRYDAVQLIGEKHVSRNWQLLAAYTWSRTRGTVNAANGENRATGGDTGRGGSFFNPNRSLNAEGRSNPDFPHQMNVQGTYRVPAWGGVNVSGSYRYLSGGAWGRITTITGLAQGNQNVRIEPRGTRRIEAGSTLDLRLEKTFPLRGSGRTTGIYFDIFNVMNQGVALGVQEMSGAAFGQPTQWSVPRRVQVAARLKF